MMVAFAVFFCTLAGFAAAALLIGNVMGGVCQGDEKNFENGRQHERMAIAGYCNDLADDLEGSFEMFDANAKKIIAENIQMLRSLAGDLRNHDSVEEMYVFDPASLFASEPPHTQAWGDPSVMSDMTSIRVDQAHVPPPFKEFWGDWGSHPDHDKAVEDVEKQLRREMEDRS